MHGSSGPAATAATVSAALAARQPQTSGASSSERGSRQPPRALASAAAADGESRRIAFRLDTPARFDTGGRSYDTLDWSIGGFALSAREASFAKNQDLRGTFTVFLDQFVVSTTVTAEVVYKDGYRLGCRFEDLSQSQIRMLRSLSAALLSGRAPSGFPVSDARSSYRRSRARSSDGSSRSKPLVTLASGSFNALLALVVVGIGLAVFFAPIEPTFRSLSGAVAADRIVVVAEATSTLDTISIPAGQPVEVDETLGYLTPLGGERAPLASPCDCVVVGYLAGIGQTIRAGEPVVQMVEAATTPVVQALFGRDEASAWSPGRRVTIVLSYSGRHIDGRIQRVSETLPEGFVGLPVSLAASPNTMVAWIEPASPLPASAVGEPVRVEFQQSTGL